MSRALDALPGAWSAVAWLGLVAAVAKLALSRAPAPPPREAVLLRAFAAVAFAVTWTFMVRMAMKDAAHYPTLAAWWSESNLFFDSYRRVTATPEAYWLSSQLMAWAPVAAVWFQLGCARRGERWWVWAWLLMCVAASVTAPLFVLWARRRPVSAPPAGLSPWTAAGVALAAPAVALAPRVHGATFVWMMLGLHVALAAPSLAPPPGPRRRRVVAVAVLVVLAVVAATIHAGATADLLRSPPGSLRAALIADPALASIGADVALTSVFFAGLVAAELGPLAGAAFLVAVPVVSLGAAFAAWLATRLARGGDPAPL